MQIKTSSTPCRHLPSLPLLHDKLLKLPWSRGRKEWSWSCWLPVVTNKRVQMPIKYLSWVLAFLVVLGTQHSIVSRVFTGLTFNNYKLMSGCSACRPTAVAYRIRYILINFYTTCVRMKNILLSPNLTLQSWLSQVRSINTIIEDGYPQRFEPTVEEILKTVEISLLYCR